MGKLRTLACCLSVLVGTGLCSAPAGATAACGNEAIREQQQSTFLPDCRAYEMVSPAEKNGGEVLTVSARTHAAAGGDAVTFSSLTAFGDAVGTGVTTEYMAERSGEAAPGRHGWSVHSITPPQRPEPVHVLTVEYEPHYEDFTADLSAGLFDAWSPLTTEPYVSNVANLYRRGDLAAAGTGSYTLMSPCTLCEATSTSLPPLIEASALGSPLGLPFEAGVSADDSHVAFESTLKLAADAKGYDGSGIINTYVADGVSTQLVGVVPASGSECVDPACVVPSGSTYFGQGTLGTKHESPYTPRVLSADGSRAVFTLNTAGEKEPVHGALYVRELASSPERTVQVNASERTDCADHTPCSGTPEPDPKGVEPATYWDASSDLSRVFFYSSEELTDTHGSGLYMFDLEKPAGKRLTLLGDATKITVVGVAEDGHYVYFAANRQLVKGEPPLAVNESGLFLWHDGAGAPADGEVRFIGELSEWGDDEASNSVEPIVVSGKDRQARITPDGHDLLFVSVSGVNLLSRYGGTDYNQTGCVIGYHNGENRCRELYLYNAERNTLACVSCRADGQPASDTQDAETSTKKNYAGTRGNFTYENRALATDGRYAFFSTAEGLVPQDTNGVSDVYEYDSATGEVHLLSSGRGADPSYFMDASADGSDVFIVTRDRLVGWDVDKAYDLYDVRAGGGLTEPAPVAPSCQGDACQAPSLAPAAVAPGTVGFAGAGNARHAKKKPAPHRKRRKHRRRVRHGRRHSRKHSGTHARRAGRHGERNAGRRK